MGRWRDHTEYVAPALLPTRPLREIRCIRRGNVHTISSEPVHWRLPALAVVWFLGHHLGASRSVGWTSPWRQTPSALALEWSKPHCFEPPQLCSLQISTKNINRSILERAPQQQFSPAHRPLQAYGDPHGPLESLSAAPSRADHTDTHAALALSGRTTDLAPCRRGPARRLRPFDRSVCSVAWTSATCQLEN